MPPAMEVDLGLLLQRLETPISFFLFLFDNGLQVGYGAVGIVVLLGCGRQR